MLATMNKVWDNPFDVFNRELNRVFNTQDADLMPVNVTEHEDAVVVEAELPGFKRDHIEVTAEDHVLTIKAQQNEKKTDTGKDGQVHIRERRIRNVTRSFRLPKTIDTTQVNAALADGILTLRLPKRAEVQPRKIDVQ